MIRVRTVLAMTAVCLLSLAGTAGLCSGGTAYSIQIAAATQKGAADETAEQMNRMGYDAFVRLETVPGKGQWYRVYVERFGSKAQADREVAALKSLGLLNECYVRALKEEHEPQPLRTEKKADPSSRLHFLHVGSYMERGNAEKAVADFEKKGQKAFFVEESVAGKRWYRIYIGEFADVKEAQSAGSALKGKGVISYFKVISLGKAGHNSKTPASPDVASRK